MINVHLFRLKDSYGNINVYVTSTELYEKVPIERFDPHWQAHYRKFPAVYLPTGATGTFGINKLESLAKTTAAKFDKKFLQPVRDIRIRYSK